MTDDERGDLAAALGLPPESTHFEMLRAARVLSVVADGERKRGDLYKRATERLINAGQSPVERKLSNRLSIARARLKHERAGIAAMIREEAKFFTGGDDGARCMAAELERVARLVERADDLRQPRRPILEG